MERPVLQPLPPPPGRGLNSLQSSFGGNSWNLREAGYGWRPGVSRIQGFFGAVKCSWEYNLVSSQKLVSAHFKRVSFMACELHLSLKIQIPCSPSSGPGGNQARHVAPNRAGQGPALGAH